VLPTFFVIGAKKSGTSSLHYYLGLHPEIHMSRMKEPNYFCRGEDGPWPIGRVTTREAYEALFGSRSRAAGESSPSYAQHAARPGVPERIRELIPWARFIYLVRDPIERWIAHYELEAGLGSPLREGLRNLAQPLEDPCLAASMYATQMERYVEVFPSERMLVVDSADLKNNRTATLREIFRFVDVDDRFESPAFEEERNIMQGHDRDSPLYARLRESRLAAVWRRLPLRARLPFSTRAMRALTEPPTRPSLDQDLREALEEVFRPEAERLRARTGKDFPSWSV
jgi:hypothetical protein